MGNSQPPQLAAPRRPHVGCTTDKTWQSAGLPEATIFEVYEVGNLLGSGSFGQVRKCWPLHDAHEVSQYAVKLVDTRSEVFKQTTAFISPRQEASILKAVKHPHIVGLVDVFEKERWLFLVLEYAQGGELFSALSNPELTVTEGSVAIVGRQLFSALRHLHEQRVVHRDVKAENILLTSDPAKTKKWHIKLIDFGLAMRIEQHGCLFQMCREQEMPLEELICGTAYYCAPEVWVNDYTPKVDVWAAGVVLYMALMGTFPFYDNDAGRLEELICDPDASPSFRAVCQKECPDYQVSAGAKRAIAELLAKDADQRPYAAAALQLPWLKSSKQRRPGSSRCFEPKFREPGPNKYDTGDDEGHQPAAEPQPIPVPIRAKAGRAAARPPVDPNKEQSRTKAFEALKRKSSPYGSGSFTGSKATESTACPMGSAISPLSSHGGSDVFSDVWVGTPTSRLLGREHESGFERKGFLPTSATVINMVEPDIAPDDISFSDSDIDDLSAVCSCR